MPAKRTREEKTELIRQAEEDLANTSNFLESLPDSDIPAHEHIEAFAEDLERRIAQLKGETDPVDEKSGTK